MAVCSLPSSTADGGDRAGVAVGGPERRQSEAGSAGMGHDCTHQSRALHLSVILSFYSSSLACVLCYRVSSTRQELSLNCHIPGYIRSGGNARRNKQWGRRLERVARSPKAVRSNTTLHLHLYAPSKTAADRGFETRSFSMGGCTSGSYGVWYHGGPSPPARALRRLSVEAHCA